MRNKMERTHYHHDERQCEECGEPFWGSERARLCSDSCRRRSWRARAANAALGELLATIDEIAARRDLGSQAFGKLLPRLFRLTAAELRRRGWEPLALLRSMPDEPAHPTDSAPGGIEGTAPTRRKWLHTPEREIELLDEEIQRRQRAHHSAAWHYERRSLLAKQVIDKLNAELSTGEE
jgi:hypothetical protein